MPDGRETSGVCASNEAEKKYSQVEKEALACEVGVTRFHFPISVVTTSLQTAASLC